MATFGQFGQSASKFLPWNPPQQRKPIPFNVPLQQAPQQQQFQPQQLPVSRFNPNVPLPTANQTYLPPQPQQQQIPGVNTPINLAEEYGKIAGNRPNRLAYQQAVEQGAPQIDRGKWAKLGALLAAGGTSLGQNSAEAGMKLGLSAYNEPQRKADAAYQERIAGLGNLANMEESDVQMKLKTLEAQNRNYYDQEGLRLDKERSIREGRTADREDKAETRAKQMADAQITNMALDNIIVVEKADGNSYLYDKGTKTESLLGKTGQTAEEDLENKKKLFSHEADVRGHYEKLHDERAALSGKEIAGINNQSRESIAFAKNETNRQVTAARLRERAASMPPDTVARRILEDMSKAIDAEELPPYAAGYLKFDENGVATADAGWTGDESLAVAVRNLIGRSTTNSRKPQEVPGSNTSTSSAGPRPPGPGTAPVVDKAVIDKEIASAPKNANGTITITSPDGSETLDIKPEEWADWRNKNAKIKGAR